MQKTIKVQDFLDAVDKNGYTWTRGAYSKIVDEAGNYKRGYCVMSQAGINLGLVEEVDFDLKGTEIDTLADLNSKLFDLAIVETERRIGYGAVNEILSPISYNDDNASSYDDVKNYIHRIWDQFADQEITFEDYRLVSTPLEEAGV